MALIECKSAQHGVPSRWVQVDGITDEEVATARGLLDRLVGANKQVSDAVARAFIAIVEMCPGANPSDLWQHVIYRHLLGRGWNDNKWKPSVRVRLGKSFGRHLHPTPFGPRSSHPKILCERRQPVSRGIEYEHPVNQSGPLLGRQCVVWVGVYSGPSM